MKLFKRKRGYISIQADNQVEEAENPKVPDGMFTKCPNCKRSIYTKDLGTDKICPECGYAFRMPAKERVLQIADSNSFEEWNETVISENPLDFPGYEEKISTAQEKTGLKAGVITGKVEIDSVPAALCVMDANFIMGSMGHAVGEKLTRTFERAIDEKLPVIVFTASGGARMQEGMISLMQMAKVSGAVAKHSDAGLLYITVLTDPTTGGVTASFAMQGDIILSEPQALVGFAGRRVIEGTIKEALPENFQMAESVLKNGFIDKIVPRKDLKKKLGLILKLH
ncbi:MAG: acetyl-CoA carboxylase, carboxyltransferase subunit beta [Pisciglobus halotolerans]|nr:acetyl-CoA carboxylase, carboxyltransferase subunit beta [Pisciglobus halotolerans]